MGIAVLNLEARIAVGCVLSLIILVAIVGNIFVCIAVFTDARLNERNNYFLVSLALADFTMAVFVMIPSIIYDIMGNWYYEYVLCEIWHAMEIIACTASVFHIALIACNRYMHVRWPHRYSGWLTPARTLMLIVVVWVQSFCIGCVMVFVGHPVEEEMDHDDRSLETHKSQNSSLYKSCKHILSSAKAIVLSVLVFWAPAVFIILNYFAVYRRTRERFRPHSDEIATAGSGFRRVPGGYRTTMIIGVLVVSFFVCWTPFYTELLVTAFCGNCVPNFAYQGITWLGYFNSGLNPIIYTIFNPRFRDAFRRMMPCLKLKPTASVSISDPKPWSFLRRSHPSWLSESFSFLDRLSTSGETTGDTKSLQEQFQKLESFFYCDCIYHSKTPVASTTGSGLCPISSDVVDPIISAHSWNSDVSDAVDIPTSISVHSWDGIYVGDPRPSLRHSFPASISYDTAMRSVARSSLYHEKNADGSSCPSQASVVGMYPPDSHTKDGQYAFTSSLASYFDRREVWNSLTTLNGIVIPNGTVFRLRDTVSNDDTAVDPPKDDYGSGVDDSTSDDNRSYDESGVKAEAETRDGVLNKQVAAGSHVSVGRVGSHAKPGNGQIKSKPERRTSCVEVRSDIPVKHSDSQVEPASPVTTDARSIRSSESQDASHIQSSLVRNIHSDTYSQQNSHFQVPSLRRSIHSDDISLCSGVWAPPYMYPRVSSHSPVNSARPSDIRVKSSSQSRFDTQIQAGSPAASDSRVNLLVHAATCTENSSCRRKRAEPDSRVSLDIVPPKCPSVPSTVPVDSHNGATADAQLNIHDGGRIKSRRSDAGCQADMTRKGASDKDMTRKKAIHTVEVACQTYRSHLLTIHCRGCEKQ